MSRHIPRFYVKHEQYLKNEKEKAVSKIQEDYCFKISAEQMHHAAGVLRLKPGNEVRIFNGDIGEWKCEICDIKKCTVRCIEQIKAVAEKKSDLVGNNKMRITIAFALINPARMSFLIEKVTELGVVEIVPIISQYTQQRKFNLQKAEQIAICACEQSGRLEPPKVRAEQDLAKFLREFQESVETEDRGSDGLDACAASEIRAKKLFVADEALRAEEHSENEEHPGNQSEIQVNRGDLCFAFEEEAIFLVGPEGGFSDAERELFDKCGAQRISLGSNILRSETAAIAMVSVAAAVAAHSLF